MRRPLAFLIATALVLPATALATTNFADDSFGRGHGSVSIQAVTNHEERLGRITELAWEGLPCGPHGSNTGTFPGLIYVRDDRFEAKGVVPVASGITIRVRGEIVGQGTRIRGTIKATGACDSGGRHKFVAVMSA